MRIGSRVSHIGLGSRVWGLGCCRVSGSGIWELKRSRCSTFEAVTLTLNNAWSPQMRQMIAPMSEDHTKTLGVCLYLQCPTEIAGAAKRVGMNNHQEGFLR